MEKNFVIGLVCYFLGGASFSFFQSGYLFDLNQDKVKVFEAGRGMLSELCSEFSKQSQHLTTRDGVEYEVVASCQPTPKAMPKP